MRRILLVVLTTLQLFNIDAKANKIEYGMYFTISCNSGGSNCINAYYHRIRLINDSTLEYSIIRVSEVTFNFSYNSIDTLTLVGKYSLLKNNLTISIDDEKICTFIKQKSDSGFNFIISGMYKMKSNYLRMKPKQLSVFSNQVLFIDKSSIQKSKCFKRRLKDGQKLGVIICLNTFWFWEQIF
ncbi:MAG: hypothetical protein A2W93_10090 [Bacteroidetes bacterium GWF2_43_63]|nr:MAG: hypothetical protein A2W93_10090 [Bacteroidetes bacterium GWF2_43_63]HBG70078.1 hypothetical protein [Bacteroidales bacterium]HCB62315.1 hypothetical protein [Bacteroidales bacterium]